MHGSNQISGRADLVDTPHFETERPGRPAAGWRCGIWGPRCGIYPTYKGGFWEELYTSQTFFDFSR